MELHRGVKLGRLILSAAFCAMIASCSPLRTFNALVPKDRGAQLAASGQSYGSHPRQRLDIYRPSHRAKAPETALPIIFFIYGGSWNAGERQGYGFAGRALAERGFLVVIADYRLVPEVRFPTFLEDNAQAFRWVIANAHRYGADPSRVVLVGHSAGAYNAAMLALDPRWLGDVRKALKGFVGIAGPYDFELDLAVTKAAFGQAPDYAATQPINFASSGDPASLMLHGAGDTLVYPRNSSALRNRLAAAGVDARVKVYADVGHVGILTAFARPFRGKAPILEDVSAFAREVVEPRAEK